MEPSWGHRVGVYAIGGCPFGEGLMLFPGPPFWLHIQWDLCFLADFEMLALAVSIYYEIGIELERHVFLRTHLQSSLFYYILFSQAKKPKKNM